MYNINNGRDDDDNAIGDETPRGSHVVGSIPIRSSSTNEASTAHTSSLSSTTTLTNASRRQTQPHIIDVANDADDDDELLMHDDAVVPAVSSQNAVNRSCGDALCV
jgi:hypothetical protein